ncbi:alpha-ketoglutarate-dependent dioxygenase AlkB [Alkalilimnicola ehrlichii]|uniref:Alpha-ketoglutarate-dependent dioxygenase AlkB n=1 Tax=Alkalilimnicola ehrlichii TaxID=351052 RepID=A0A3E0WXJ3_9GAMM|nr:DNA oxidative demethylase AlkB [Alkalilimnicola ehrlichii]RFA29370.1 alpha-ketoglutarate-dependent dioxygenase AlkB [Alkalilimnicola ehrlichii]RFA36883.1 alpha-ketoglutarate-dependent dioxygenase AlkB [Alkalilimnicola ehrlichii]
MDDLFDGQPREERIAPGAWLLHGFVSEIADTLLDAARQVAVQAPFRHMLTPGGHRMSAAMTNCGTAGWVSDAHGYRYQRTDPDTGKPWPSMPEVFRQLAKQAAATAGFPDFIPDACLINRYQPGTRLSLHQDRNERDINAPIVSVSLGLPAIFLFGGNRRSNKPQRYRLAHGDVAVWGGPSRLAYHGVAPIANGHHPATGECRINLTLRKAL